LSKLQTYARSLPSSAWGAIALFVAFSLCVPRFASAANLSNVLRQASIVGIVACGQAIVIILGGIEFSFGSSVGLASVIVVLSAASFGVVGAFCLGAAVVVTIGLINGIIIAWFKVPPFIVTLGMLMAVFGIAATLAGGLPIEAPAGPIFTWLARGRVLGVPVPIFTALAAAAGLYVLLNHAEIGRRWYLVGSNPLSARLAGIKVDGTIIAGYVAAAAFCALGAILLTARVASGQPNLAPNLSFDTIASCAIGGLSLSGGTGRTGQVVCGVLILAAVNNAVVLSNLPAAYQQILTAAILIGAVLLQIKGRFILFRPFSKPVDGGTR
jgi:ribose/xylose/arabinose/galactoside ABC-type transport system permease subunit